MVEDMEWWNGGMIWNGGMVEDMEWWNGGMTE
jgi:hypothetical protein